MNQEREHSVGQMEWIEGIIWSGLVVKGSMHKQSPRNVKRISLEKRGWISHPNYLAIVNTLLSTYTLDSAQLTRKRNCYGPSETLIQQQKGLLLVHSTHFNNMTSEFHNAVTAMLRPTEHCMTCLEFLYSKHNTKRKRIMVIIADAETRQRGCILIMKRKTPTSLSIRHVLPIHSEFKFALAQTKPPKATNATAMRNSIFILKINQDDGVDIRLETESLAVTQNACSLLKQLSNNAERIESKGFKDMIEFYSKMQDIANGNPYPDDEMDQDNLNARARRARDKNQNPFIAFDSDVRPQDFKAIKNGWIAKELRNRENEFSLYFDLNVHIGTWNVNGRPPTEPLDPWIHEFNFEKADVLVLGFQEVDLSTEAFIRSGASIKEEEWAKAVEASLKLTGVSFKKIASKQLVGMLILVYIHEKHVDFVKDVSACSVGCGILGVMGNKGGVGVRIKIYDSYITFINSHLAADVLQVDRRNQDFLEICARMEFPLSAEYETFTDYTLKHPWVATHMDVGWNINNENVEDALNNEAVAESADMLMKTPVVKTTCTIFDCDHLFWFGDLNYRIPIPDVEAKAILNEEGGIQKLLALDQLSTEIKAGRAFFEFQEQPITFNPSFKYDVGTDTFDTSEKRRAPSYCDRILWLKNPIHREKTPDFVQPRLYKMTMNPKFSDHKPILGSFSIKCRQINQDAKTKTFDKIVLDLDRFENDALPDLHVNTNILEFGSIRYLESITKTILLENKGQVLAKFKFISTQEGAPYCKTWCSINPPFGMLLPGEKTKINIKIHVNFENAAKLNFQQDDLNDILILHTKNGKDHFISINAEWQVSSFGNDLDVLCRLRRPARSLSSKDCSVLKGAIFKMLQENSDPGTSVMLPEMHELIDMKKKLSVPKEIWRLVDFIYRYGMDVDHIFQTRGDPETMEYIIECLDNGMDFDLIALLQDKTDFVYEEQALSTSSLVEGIYSTLPTAVSAFPPTDPDTLPLLESPVAPSPTTLENEIELDIDLILQSKKDSGKVLPASRKVASKSRPVVVYSMVECMFHFLEALSDPVLPFSLHHQCIQEGYHSITAGKMMLQMFPESHYHLFMYLMSFFREFKTMYNGQPELTVDKLADILAPILCKSPPDTFTNPSSDQPKSNVETNGRKSMALETDMSRMNISQKYATVSGSSTVTGLLDTPQNGTTLFGKSSLQQQDVLKKERTQYELRRKMFVMQFLDVSNPLD